MNSGDSWKNENNYLLYKFSAAEIYHVIDQLLNNNYEFIKVLLNTQEELELQNIFVFNYFKCTTLEEVIEECNNIANELIRDAPSRKIPSF